MNLKFDNVEDARAKLNGTYCYFKGQAIIVKNVEKHPENGRYYMRTTNLNGGVGPTVFTDDPDFNCYDYNLGYVNWMHSVVWYYRAPARQYRQGLRSDQVRSICANGDGRDRAGFAASQNLANMLENVYPRAEEVKHLIESGEYQVVAFHKNFAAKWDRIHGDFIVEYKGKLIGHTKDFHDFKLMEEYVHLTEAIREAVG